MRHFLSDLALANAFLLNPISVGTQKRISAFLNETLIYSDLVLTFELLVAF